MCRCVYISVLLVLIFSFNSCYLFREVSSNDPGLGLMNGKVSYKGTFFSGRVRQTIAANGEVMLKSYVNGVEEGVQKLYDRNGNLLFERPYRNGRKDSVHKGWYSNGKYRFYYQFDMGSYTGEQWEWHDNGKVKMYQKYDEDSQLSVSKHWRRSGQIYINQVFKDGSALGMPGSKLCNPVKKDVQ